MPVAIGAGLILLAVAVPFAREQLFSQSGAQLPLFALPVSTLSYTERSPTNPHVEGTVFIDKNHVCNFESNLPDADQNAFSYYSRSPGALLAIMARLPHSMYGGHVQQIPDADPGTFSIIDTVPQGEIYTAGGEYAKKTRTQGSLFPRPCDRGADPAQRRMRFAPLIHTCQGRPKS